MCVACIEFVKQTLNVKEFKSALWEVTRENEAHLTEVERLIQVTGGDPEKLREKLRNQLVTR